MYMYHNNVDNNLENFMVTQAVKVDFAEHTHTIHDNTPCALQTILKNLTPAPCYHLSLYTQQDVILTLS